MSNLPNIDASTVLNKLGEKLGSTMKDLATYEVFVDAMSKEREDHQNEVKALNEEITRLKSIVETLSPALPSDEDETVVGEVVNEGS